MTKKARRNEEEELGDGTQQNREEGGEEVRETNRGQEGEEDRESLVQSDISFGEMQKSPRAEESEEEEEEREDSSFVGRVKGLFRRSFR